MVKREEGLGGGRGRYEGLSATRRRGTEDRLFISEREGMERERGWREREGMEDRLFILMKRGTRSSD